MKISAKTEYACLAMLELARNEGSAQPVRAAQIAETHGIPVRFLVQILLQLKAAGLVRSTRGAAGGYRLARPPVEATLADVLAAVEGASTSSPPEETASPALRVLQGVWRSVNLAEQKLLERITLADLAQQIEQGGEGMYYI